MLESKTLEEALAYLKNRLKPEKPTVARLVDYLRLVCDEPDVTERDVRALLKSHQRLDVADPLSPDEVRAAQDIATKASRDSARIAKEAALSAASPPERLTLNIEVEATGSGLRLIRAETSESIHYGASLASEGRLQASGGLFRVSVYKKT